MNAQVVLSRNAVSDLHAIVDYISVDNARRGYSFVEEVSVRIVNKLSIFPESGVKVGKLRYVAFGSYVAIHDYDAAKNLVTVAMVTEGHRNWRTQFEEPL